MQTIFRAEICGRGETLEDAEIAWRRNVRRMMEAVRLVSLVHTERPDTLTVDDFDRYISTIATLTNTFYAASDPRQETPWPQEVLNNMSLLDRIKNSHGGSNATSVPF